MEPASGIPVDRPSADLAVTPTVVKHYFQYRCDRQARYLMLRPSARTALAIAVQPQPTGIWAEEGTGYEHDVVSALAEREGVLRLDELEASADAACDRLLAFLRRDLDARYAYQAPLDLSGDQELR